jgi:hypothetical protein
MTEQDLGIDPKTGKRKPKVPSGDAAQNLNYTRHTDPAETARDYSRPRTIPKEEFEETTGKSWDDAVAEFDANEAKRKQEEKDRLAAE